MNGDYFCFVLKFLFTFAENTSGGEVSSSLLPDMKSLSFWKEILRSFF
jgi:hypothetical protein